MNTVRRILICFCLNTLVFGGLQPAMAQQPNNQPVESNSSATPKDIYTRAKLHTELGSMYFQGGNLIVALEELTIALSINPDYAQGYSTRGLVLYHVNELESAEKDFQRALKLAEKDPEINNNYGWFLCQTGKVKESISYFQRAIKNPLYQTPEIAYLNVGACYTKLGELDLAEESIRRTLRFLPEHPPALFQLALIGYKRGNYEAAKENLKKVVRLTDPNAETLWLFLRVERRLGNHQEESSLTAQLRRKYPDSPEYQAYLKGNFE